MAKSDGQKTQARPPVVVVMGHVDHGKTTLLDYIRKTNLAAREAGGITQHIGAYEIEHQGKKITFIDTPGHEAFQKMRSAGATVADLAVLVVAADEGVKPQTREAIEILNDTKTPYVVALTKIDKKEANVEKAKKDLTAAGVLLEGYGGQVSYHDISAKTGEGVNELLDLILLAAEVEHFTYDPGAPPTGFILEAKIDRRRGREVTMILGDGVLKTGEYLATPTAKGKVKILEDFLGKRVAELHPSAPAVIIGFEELPRVGETFFAGAGEEVWEKLTGAGKKKARELLRETDASGEKRLKLILKAHDLGSLEALSLVVRNLKVEKQPLIFEESVGDVSDGDVKNAIAASAKIVGFKVRVNQAAKNLSEANRVTIITSDIIYELVKIIEETLAGPAAAETRAALEILAVFNKEKPQRQLVGGRMTEGVFRNKMSFEIERAGETVGRGRIVNLQSQKKDVGQVNQGDEAGILVNSDILINVGDRLIIKK